MPVMPDVEGMLACEGLAPSVGVGVIDASVCANVVEASVATAATRYCFCILTGK